MLEWTFPPVFTRLDCFLFKTSELKFLSVKWKTSNLSFIVPLFLWASVLLLISFKDPWSHPSTYRISITDFSLPLRDLSSLCLTENVLEKSPPHPFHSWWDMCKEICVGISPLLSLELHFHSYMFSNVVLHKRSWCITNLQQRPYKERAFSFPSIWTPVDKSPSDCHNTKLERYHFHPQCFYPQLN